MYSDEIAINNKRKPFEEWQKDFGVPFRSADARFELRGEDPEQRAALEVAQHPASELCSASRREVRPGSFAEPQERERRIWRAAIGVALRVGKVSRYMTASDIARSVRSSYSKGADRTEEVIIAQNVAVLFW